jgi:hypothetical protein
MRARAEPVIDHFEREDLKFFEPDGKVGILATLDPDGLPHLTLVTAMQARDERHLIFGQFCEGRGKRYAEERKKVGFLFMTLDRRLWRGTALWTGKSQSGPEHELMNRKPMWRYNSYFGIHTVHYLDLVSVTPGRGLPMAAVLRGVLAGALRVSLGAGRNRGTELDRGTELEPLNPWTRAFIRRPGNLKFVSYVAEDGFPRIVPQLAATCPDGCRILLPGAEYPADLARIPAGAAVALFAMSLDMEDVLVRGRYEPRRRGGVIDVDWVYNSMPPVAEQIYPPADLARKVEAF